MFIYPAVVSVPVPQPGYNKADLLRNFKTKIPKQSRTGGTLVFSACFCRMCRSVPCYEMNYDTGFVFCVVAVRARVLAKENHEIVLDKKTIKLRLTSAAVSKVVVCVWLICDGTVDGWRIQGAQSHCPLIPR